MPNWLRKDPTRTTLLRRKFVADMTRRFKALSKAIEELVVKDDVFGLEKREPFTIMQMNERRAWAFRSSAKKVQAYRDWLQQQVDAKILAPVDGISGKSWTATYVESAYRKGMVRAYTDLNSIDLAKSPDFYAGGKAQFLRSAFGSPEALQKMELLYTRSYQELKGVTDVMSQQMSRVLATGLSRGEGPAKISRELRKVVTTMKKTRADTIARTEVIAAHAEGQLDSFERLGVEEVSIMAEWSTAGDDRVCELCAPLEGVVMTIAEARGLLPRHPNCRCAWIPANKARREKGQKRGKRKDQAISRSIGAEAPKKLRRSLADVHKRSVWAGEGRVSVPVGKVSKVSKVSKAVTDAFGSRIGTKAAEINSFLKEGSFVRVKDIVGKTGYPPQQISGQLNKLMKKGLIRRDGNRGYTMVRGLRVTEPVPIRIPKPVTKPSAVRVGKPKGTRFETAEEYRQHVIKESEKAFGKDYKVLQKKQARLDKELVNIESKMDDILNAPFDDPAEKLMSGLMKLVDKLQMEKSSNLLKMTKIERKALRDIRGMRKLLSEKGSMKFSIRGREFGGYRSVMDDILDWMPKSRVSSNEQWGITNLRIQDRMKGKVGVGKKAAEMGTYDDKFGMITMNVRDKATYAHEFGHHLSYRMQGFMKDQNRFFIQRTRGESTRSIVGGFRGRKDKFANYDSYAGRVYNNGEFPEIASVGIEQIWINPYQAAIKDPEWFNMIIRNLKKLES